MSGPYLVEIPQTSVEYGPVGQLEFELVEAAPKWSKSGPIGPTLGKLIQHRFAHRVVVWPPRAEPLRRGCLPRRVVPSNAVKVNHGAGTARVKHMRAMCSRASAKSMLRICSPIGTQSCALSKQSSTQTSGPCCAGLCGARSPPHKQRLRVHTREAQRAEFLATQRTLHLGLRSFAPQILEMQAEPWPNPLWVQSATSSAQIAPSNTHSVPPKLVHLGRPRPRSARLLTRLARCRHQNSDRCRPIVVLK